MWNISNGRTKNNQTNEIPEKNACTISAIPLSIAFYELRELNWSYKKLCKMAFKHTQKHHQQRKKNSNFTRNSFLFSSLRSRLGIREWLNSGHFAFNAIWQFSSILFSLVACECVHVPCPVRFCCLCNTNCVPMQKS